MKPEEINEFLVSRLKNKKTRVDSGFQPPFISCLWRYLFS